MSKYFQKGSLFTSLLLCSFALNAQNLKNVITVSETGGDFSDINSALYSIYDASESNPYLIKIGPGIYRVRSQIRLKEHVSIKGSGVELTKLIGRIKTPVESVVAGQENATLSDLTIESYQHPTFPIQSAFSCTKSRCGTIERVSIVSTASPRIEAPAIGMLLNVDNIEIKDSSIYANKRGGEAIGIDSRVSSMIIKDSIIIGGTTGVRSFGSEGLEIRGSTVIGSSYGIDTLEIITAAKFVVNGSFIGGRVPIKIARDLEDLSFNYEPYAVISNTQIRKSRNFSTPTLFPYIELEFDAKVRCIGSYDDIGNPLTIDCNLPQ